MALTFESVLDRHTALGPMASSGKRSLTSQSNSRQQHETDGQEESPSQAVHSPDDETRILRQAMRSANTGITLLQLAEGSITEISQLFQEVRELVSQATETLRTRERLFFQAKLSRLTARANELAANTIYEGIHLFNGQAEQVTIQVDAEGLSERFDLPLPDLRATFLGVDPANLDLSSSQGSKDALPIIDAILLPLDEHRKTFSNVQEHLETILHELELRVDDSTHLSPRIRGADLAIRTAALLKEYISHESKAAVAGQIDSIHSDAKHLVS